MKKHLAAGITLGLLTVFNHMAFAEDASGVSAKDKFVQACMDDRTLNVMRGMYHSQPERSQTAETTNSSAQGNRESCEYAWEMSDQSGKYEPSLVNNVNNANGIDVPFTAGPVAYVFLRGHDIEKFCPPGTAAGEVIVSKSSKDISIPWLKPDGTETTDPYTVKGIPTNVRFVCPNVPDLAMK